MCVKSIITQLQQYGTVFLSIMMIIWSAFAFSQGTEDEKLLANDLRTALTLQGINCDGISNVETDEQSNHDVVCDDGGHYVISQTGDGIIRIVDKVTGIVRKGMGRFLGVVPLTGHMFQKREDLTEHEAEIARSLFSIIELSGEACNAITGVKSSSSNEHIVSCAGGDTYRVYTGEDGLVKVEDVSGDGN